MVKKGFVKVYNSFTDSGSEYFLTTKEMYVYAYLKMLESKSGDVMVNVDFLHTIMPVKFEENPTRNKKQVSKVINSLINKNIMECNIVEFNNKDKLLLNVNDRKFGSGHEQIKCSLIESFEEYQYLYIYVFVSRFQNTEKGYLEFSYTDWSNLLNMHRTTVIGHLKQCEEKGYIHIKLGNYNEDIIEERGQRKQDKNKYSLKSFNDNPVEAKVDKNDSDAPEEDTGNWGKGINLNENDFDIYVYASPDQQKEWDKQLLRIKNSGDKGLGLYNNLLMKWMNEAKQRKERKDREDKEGYFEKLCSKADNIMSKVVGEKRIPIDVALMVNDKIKIYNNCSENEKNSADVLFYEYLEDNTTPFGGRLNAVTKYIENPKREDVEYYRPCNYGGRWRSSDDDRKISQEIEPFDFDSDDYYDEDILNREF